MISHPPSPAIFRLEAITRALSLSNTEAARQFLAPYAPRGEIEADLAEQIVYLRALIRDATRRAFSPGVTDDGATRLHTSIRGFQRDLRAMITALQRSQLAPVMLSDPDWDRSPYRRPIGPDLTIREDGSPLEPIETEPARDAGPLRPAQGDTPVRAAVSRPAEPGEHLAQSKPPAGAAVPGSPRPVERSTPDAAAIRASAAVPMEPARTPATQPGNRASRRRMPAWARKTESGDALARFASRRMEPEA